MKLDLDFGTTTAWLMTVAGLGLLVASVWMAFREKGKGGPEFLASGVFAAVGFIALCLTVKTAALVYLLIPYGMLVAIAWIERIMISRAGFFSALLYGAVALSVLAFIGNQIWAAVKTEVAGLTAVTETGEPSRDAVTEEDVQAGAEAVVARTLKEVEARQKQEATAQPIQITEVVPGKAWRFRLAGPTDAATVLQTVATAHADTTISVLRGHTYRFSASGSIRGRVHLARRYADGQFWDSVLPAAELHLPGPGEAVRAHAFCPRQDGTATLWIEGGDSRPQEIVVLNTGESAALVVDQRRYDNSGVRIN